MPTYEYRCPSCGVVREIVHSIKEAPQIRCEACTGDEVSPVMERLISRNSAGFIFKTWTPSMAYKESRSRHRKNADLEMRQLERYGSGPRLQPNVAGHEVDTWSDAAKLAKEAGMSTESYQPMIEREKTISKVSNVDDRKWKKAKDKKDKA